MTKVTLSKWGNTQAVRIPKALRNQAGVVEGDVLDAQVLDDGSIVLKPVKKRRVVVRYGDLGRLFDEAGWKPEDHVGEIKEVDWGPPVGREVGAEDGFGNPAGLEAL